LKGRYRNGRNEWINEWMFVCVCVQIEVTCYYKFRSRGNKKFRQRL